MSLTTSIKRRAKKFLDTGSESASISDEELKILNNGVLDYLRSLDSEELTRRVESVCCREPSDSDSLSSVSSMLDENGIVILPGFLGEQEAEEAKSHVDQVIAEVERNDPRGTGFENTDFLVQGEKQLLEGYGPMADHPKAVVSIRQGKDQGMVDVFNVDRLLGDVGKTVREVYSKEWLIQLLKEYEEAIHPANLNVYINRSITSTRGFHADSYQRTIKGFIYLTDVESLDDGPYCFVKGTHVETPWRTANKAIGALTSAGTESPFVDPLNVVPVLGKKGTLVLSDQSGIHRGIPQNEGALREVLVMRYK